jgi:DNA-binding CsgD family transcriptional regulator
MNASISSEPSLGYSDRILDQLAIIVLSPHSEIRMMTHRSWQLLHAYFHHPFALRDRFPQILQDWINQQISLLQSTPIIPPQLPLLVEQGNKRLSIRFSAETLEDDYLLLLEEQSCADFSIQAFELLGLTKREAEVFYWLAQGRTTQDISETLSISTLTVKKHLEHIYDKFSVQTRAAALVYAFERLGILN